jgi:hypothetical protein
MKPTISNVDIVDNAVLVTFSDGTAALFDADFLYAHREEQGSDTLTEEGEV